MNTRDYLRRRVTAAVYRRLTPAELFALARDGDGEAFAALVCRKYAHVAAVCRAVLGPGGPVEDVTLDVFLALWRQRAAIRDPGRLDGWLARTARNRATKSAAARAREQDRVADEPIGGQDPAAAAEKREVADRVRRALAELKTIDRDILAVAGATGADGAAASLLGLSVATYRTRLHRARQRLRVVLERYGLGPLLGALVSAGGVAGRGWRTGWGKLLLIGVVAFTVTAAGMRPRPSAPPAPAGPTAAPESLGAKNLRLFDADVRPRLQAALDSLVTGDRGEARITAVEAPGSRVWVAAEVRHGPPQTHTTRLRLTFCTHTRARLFYADPWGPGVLGSVDPRDPILLSRNRVGVPDRTRPLYGLRDAQAAFERLPPDPRGAAAMAADRAALGRVIGLHTGAWAVPGCRLTPASYPDHPEIALDITPPAGSRFPAISVLWLDLRPLPDGRVEATCGTGGGVVLSADGSRVEFPQSGDRWERPGDWSGGANQE